jgi:transposase
VQDLATLIAELEQERAQLRELLHQQREQNGQQREEIAELKALVVELREELNRHSGNSSRPPSSDSPSQREKNRQKRKRRATKKRRGGQPGHKGRCRELLPKDEVDAVKDHYPGECENCWRPLSKVPDADCMRFQVTELLTFAPKMERILHRARPV